MQQIEFNDFIAIIASVVANAILIAGVFIKLNVKISENTKDIASNKADFEEHKVSNRADIREIKDIISKDRLENKDELNKISKATEDIKSSISNLRVDIAKITMYNEYADKINRRKENSK